MNSIDAKNNASALPDPTGTPTTQPLKGEGLTPEAIAGLLASGTGLSTIEMLGMPVAGLNRLARGEPANKFATSATITSSAPPMPNDRVLMSPAVEKAWANLSRDINQAMIAASSTQGGLSAASSAEGSQSIATGIGAAPNAGSKGAKGASSSTGRGTVGQSSGNAMMTQLGQISDAEAGTPAGQAKVNNLVLSGAQAAVSNISLMSSAGMMMAFMMLQVQNRNSGKEVTGTLQDLTTDARKESINQQIAENKVAEQATEKAAKKQQLMSKLGPLIDAIMLIASIAISVLTFGAGTGLAVMLAAAVIGFVVGGAVGGKKNGDGFDMSSALSGAALGASIGGSVASLFAKIAEKLVLKLVEKLGMDGVKQMLKQSGKEGLNLSKTTTQSINAVASATTFAGGVAQGAMNLAYNLELADAKQAQAYSKLQKAISDMLQTQYQGLSDALQNMVELHNSAVNQVLSMLKTQFAAEIKAVSQISSR